MESRQYHRLNPFALALAAGAAAIVLSSLILLPAIGIHGMMGGRYGGYGGYGGPGGYGGSGWMMGGYGGRAVPTFGIMWFAGVLAVAFAGAVVAWVYNAVHSARPAETADRASEIRPS